jgi:hypothetical protein
LASAHIAEERRESRDLKRKKCSAGHDDKESKVAKKRKKTIASEQGERGVSKKRSELDLVKERSESVVGKDVNKTRKRPEFGKSRDSSRWKISLTLKLLLGPVILLYRHPNC